MTDPHFDQKRPGEPKRDQYGRYLLPDPNTGEERAWTRATTISGLLSDRYNLEQWSQRMVAQGMAASPDLIAKVRTLNAQRDKKQLNGIVSDAKERAASSSRANIGTAIHSATEAFDRGDPVDLGEPYNRDVDAYVAKMRELNITVVPGWIERIVVNPNLGAGVAGTLDRMVTQQFFPAPRIADIKTGSTVHFAELDHAIQQAIYANATHYWDEETESLVEMPEVDRETALIIHIPAGTAECAVHALNITVGWQAAQVAADIHANWRKRKDLSRAFA